MTGSGHVALVRGPSGVLPGRTSVGVFEILNTDLDVVAAGVLRTLETRVSLPGPGTYLLRGVVPAHGPTPRIFEERIFGRNSAGVWSLGGGSATGGRADDPEPEPDSAGWLAAWRPEVDSGSYEPVAVQQSRVDGTDLVVADSAEHGETVILQWAVGQGSPRCTAVPAGTLVRFSGVRNPEPGSDEAFLLLRFLDRGDVLRADVLAGPGRTMPDDVAFAVAIGYFLLGTGDDRLAGWAEALVDRWPRSFDAYLLRGWARLHGDGWQRAGAAFQDATRCGLPLAARGLRLLDDALRMVGDVAGQQPGAVRGSYLPYLRAVSGTGLTTFQGVRPETPAPWPVSAEPPPHARTWRLTGGRLRLGAAAGGTAAIPAGHVSAVTALLEGLQGLVAAPLAVAGTRGASGPPAGGMLIFDLPGVGRDLLGPAVRGRVLAENGELRVVLAPVPPVSIAVATGPDAPVWSVAEHTGPEIAVARLPWTAAEMPPTIYVAVGRAARGRR